MKTMTIPEYLTKHGIPTTTSGVLFSSRKDKAKTGSLFLRFGEGDLVKDGGTAQCIWLTRTSCEANGWVEGTNIFNKIGTLQMMEVNLTSGGTGWKMGRVGELVAQQDIRSLFSEADQALFAELEAAAETKI